jgi:hypothetical protein
VARAAGALPPPDGPPAQPSEMGSGCKTGLFAGCCCPGAAPCAVCVPHAGWNGQLRAARRLRLQRRRPLRGAPCAGRRLLHASGAGTHRTFQQSACPGPAGARVPASHPTQANQRNSCANEFGRQGAAYLHRFVEKLPQNRLTIALRFSFRRHALW